MSHVSAPRARIHHVALDLGIVGPASGQPGRHPIAIIGQRFDNIHSVKEEFLLVCFPLQLAYVIILDNIHFIKEKDV